MQATVYREVMVGGRYQAQFKCPGCGGWVLTDNLEVHREQSGTGKNLSFEKVAVAADVFCTSKTAGKPPCGEDIGDVIFRNWKYSTPVKWAEQRDQPANEKASTN